MTWDEYYDKFYEWADSTQISRLSSLTAFSPNCSAEVLEVAQCFVDDKIAIRLINKALAGGVRFSVDEVMELACMIEKPMLTRLVDTATEPFSKEQLEELYMLIDDDVFERVSKRNKIDIFADDEEYDDTFIEEPSEPKLGFFTKVGLALGVVSALDKGHKRHSGRCNGDCAHCPPHYGYRYGHWYYGHHHQHGCEFGGNKGL